ncbi:hypothetical protein B0O99DRAFT_521179, partial [Bisporella sp. PMI_857]
NYNVGWISAIHPEHVAASVFLDEKDDGPYHTPLTDSNAYTLGKIKEHNAVIAVLPAGDYDLVTASHVASNMMSAFPNIKIGLTVGIGGGAPSHKHDIHLGDIVVSIPSNGLGGVFHYNFGKLIQGREFKDMKHLNKPPALLRAAVNGLKTEYAIHGQPLERSVDDILDKYSNLRGDYSRPDPSTNRLYKSKVLHSSDDSNCAAVCSKDPSDLVQRSERPEGNKLIIHYGLIASADQLMKNALIRDKLVAGKDILAVGLVDSFPCLAIRGICDYSDTHKK